MPTDFPTDLDVLTNPSDTDDLDTPGVLHDEQHANANDAIEALEAKVGKDGSADTDSHDFKIGVLEDHAAETTSGDNAHGAKTYIDAAVAALINAAPGVLDTLDELAAALGDDANFASTVTTALAGKQATSAKGAANGYGSLDAAARQPFAERPAFVGASAYKTANQSISASTETAVTFASELFDSDAIHDNSTNPSRFTVPAGKAGKWRCAVTLAWAGDNTGTRAVAVAKNGTVVRYLQTIFPGGTTAMSLSGDLLLELVAGDYIEFIAWHNASGSINVLGSASGATFAEFLWQGP